jgi:hypothetical protein
MKDPEERNAYFMNEVINYWKSQPGRALHGWAWRLQHFLGLHENAMLGRGVKRIRQRSWGARIHPWAVLSLLALIALRLSLFWRTKGSHLESILSLGLVVALLFGVYAAVHSMFAYTGFRYVTASIPTLAAAVAMLASEIWPTQRHQLFKTVRANESP